MSGFLAADLMISAGIGGTIAAIARIIKNKRSIKKQG